MLRSFFTTVLFGVVLLVVAGLDITTPVLNEITTIKEFNAFELVRTIALCLFSYFGLFFYVKSLQVEKVSIAVPISNIGSLFGVATAIVFLGEQVNVAFSVVCVILFAGVLLVNGRKIHSLKISSGVFFNILAAFFWGVSFALFVFPIKALGVLLFSFILEASVCLFSLLLLTTQGKTFSFPLRKTNWAILLLALFGFSGVAFYNLALLHLPIAQISLLTLLTPVVSVTAAAILFKERLTVRQYLGVMIIFIGLAILKFM